MLGYWAKLLSQKDDKLSKVFYNLLYNKYSLNEFNSKWLLHIKHTLDSSGYSNLFMTHNPIKNKWLNESLKLRLFDQYQQTWKCDVLNSSKGVNYRIFKENFGFEDYLDILDTKERISFCRFRTCNHKLVIETGRWQNIERNDRKCNFCDKNDLGDEFHYLLVCPYLGLYRNRFINMENRTNVNIIKYKNLLQSKNMIVLKKLCKFITYINTLII